MHFTATRRRSLQLLAAPLVSMAWPAKAQDPLTTAAVSLQLGQAVLGMFARKKQGPDMAQVMLSAVLENQRVLSQQVADLQESVAFIITQLGQFDEKLRKSLDVAALRSMQDRLRAIDLAYMNILGDASRYPSFQEWVANANVQRDLQNLARSCQDAVEQVAAANRLDAVTMLQLMSVLRVSLGVNIALGRNQGELKNRAQFILDIFERASTFGTAGSSATALDQYAALLVQVRQNLEAEGIQLPGSGQTTTILLGKVTVEDYVPATTRKEEVCRRTSRGGGPGKGTGGGDGIEETCTWKVTPVPAVHGPRSTFQYQVQLQSTPLTAGATAPTEVAALLSYSMGSQTSVVPAESSSGARIHQTRAPAAAQRSAAAESLRDTEGAAKRETLRRLLSQHNQYAGMVALNAVALSSMNDTRHEVFSFFGVPL